MLKEVSSVVISLTFLLAQSSEGCCLRSIANLFSSNEGEDSGSDEDILDAFLDAFGLGDDDEKGTTTTKATTTSSTTSATTTTTSTTTTAAPTTPAASTTAASNGTSSASTSATTEKPK